MGYLRWEECGNASLCCRWVEVGQLMGEVGAACMAPTAAKPASSRPALSPHLKVGSHDEPDAGGQQRAQHAIHVEVRLVLHSGDGHDDSLHYSRGSEGA